VSANALLKNMLSWPWLYCPRGLKNNKTITQAMMTQNEIIGYFLQKISAANFCRKLH